jgi:DNA helicase II / ATP-dependent DNA helicase PcrA
MLQTRVGRGWGYSMIHSRHISHFGWCRGSCGRKPSSSILSRYNSPAIVTANPWSYNNHFKLNQRQSIAHASIHQTSFRTKLEASSASQEHDGNVGFSISHVSTESTSPVSPVRASIHNGHRLVRSPPFPSYLRDLNPSQVDAVTQPLQGMTRVIAGPGSGKTRVLACRIAHILAHDPSARLLAVTFTRKAAQEMTERLHTILLESASSTTTAMTQTPSPDSMYTEETYMDPSSAGAARAMQRVTLGTFHSVCAKILRWHGESLCTLSSVRDFLSNNEDDAGRLTGQFSIADQSDQVRILRDCLEKRKIDIKDIRLFDILSAMDRYREAMAQGKDLFQQGSRSKPMSPVMKVVQEIFPHYRYALLSSNHLDYNDLIYLTNELVQQYPDIQNNLQRRWTHVLVDEFQDTSHSQLTLVQGWTSSSLLVVGDADQSIYSWRGAHAGSLAEFATLFQNYPGGVHTVYLMENYR